MGEFTLSIAEARIKDGLSLMLSAFVAADAVSPEHVDGTPDRYVKALNELFSGVEKTPEEALNTLFPADHCDTMVHVKEITFFSTCAHHVLPFFGKASFAYIPKDSIVGLSKIPRLVEVYARRPQVQEKLSTDIVHSFQDIVAPLGCGIMIRAYHLCCMSRGIKQPTSYTETTALSGVFKTDATVKSEFLTSANAGNWKIF